MNKEKAIAKAKSKKPKTMTISLVKDPQTVSTYDLMFESIAKKWCGVPVYMDRSPTPEDINHQVGESWLNHKKRKVFILCSLNGGKAHWEEFKKRGHDITKGTQSIYNNARQLHVIARKLFMISQQNDPTQKDKIVLEEVK